MLRSLENLEFIVSTSQGLEIDFRAQSEMIELMSNFQGTLT